MRWLRFLLFLLVVFFVVGHQAEEDDDSLESIIELMKIGVVSEDDILMEEIKKSTKNVDDLFDSDSPGKIGERRKRRKRRQVNQDDIRDGVVMNNVKIDD